MKFSSWPVVLIIISSILFARTRGDFSSGANQAVRCILSHNSPKDCTTLPRVIVPSYLLQEYNDSPSSLHESLRKNTLVQLPEDEVANIPLSLIYLIPRARLADLNGNQLRAILQKYADEKSLVHQVSACLHHGNNMFKIFEKMKNVILPQESLQILAETIEITDLTEDFLNLSCFQEQPFLAYLRPDVLFKAKSTIFYSILISLQLTKPPSKSAFYFLTEYAIRHEVSLSKLNGFELGLSPDQLLNETLSFDHSVASFKLDLSILQARALFERIYQKTSLSMSNFIDSKPLLFKLSPELLQQFPQRVHEYEVSFIEGITSIPLPTACQITEYVKADCVLTRRLPKDENEFWDIHIRHLGKWVYTLPLSALEGYKTKELNTAVLKTLESPAISSMQAYYLTGKGRALDVMTPNSVLELGTFLHALPASQLANRKLGEISSHVLLHLVSKLPANNLPRTLSLVNKIASSIGDTTDGISDDYGGDSSVLEELLENSDINQIMPLLSPKDLALSTEAILKFFAEKRIRTSFGKTIEQLPQQFLAALLEHDRLKNGYWNWRNVLDSSHISHLLVGGLTCEHVEDMNLGLFIPIISHYNSLRKKPFPKNLQHCCLKKLIDHLNLKMVLTQTEPDFGLISVLEPIEIESIKGFVLVNLPLDAMRVSPYLGHILSNIGQLSNTELMLSTDISRLKLIAGLAVDKERNVNTYLVRNLIWFLPPNTNAVELRLVLEAKLLDTTICLPTEDRRQIATRLLAEYGPTEGWSAGVLATLQDLLIVFNDEELGKIPLSSWTNAADSFKSHYNDYVDWTEPSTFYKVCTIILGEAEKTEYTNSIGRYIHWRLKAAQWLLDTVVAIPQPNKTNNIPNHIYIQEDDTLDENEEQKTHISIFNPEVELESTEEEEEDESEADEETEDYEEENYEETTKIENSTYKTSPDETTTDVTKIDVTITKNSFIEEITEERTVEKDSSTDKSANYQNVPLDVVTQSSEIQISNTSTGKSFGETQGKPLFFGNITETPVTKAKEELKVSVLSSTTPKTVTLMNITSTSTKSSNISQDKTFTAGVSKITNENTTNNDTSAPCSICQEDNSIKSNSTESKTSSEKTFVTKGEIVLNKTTGDRNDTTSQILPNTLPSILNETSQILPNTLPSILNETSELSENQSEYSSIQNSSPIPSESSINLTEVEVSKSNQSDNIIVTPSDTENQFYENSETTSLSEIPNSAKSLVESSSKTAEPLYTNNIENIKSPENTLDKNSQNHNNDNSDTPKHESSNEDYSGEDMEPMGDFFDQNKNGILMDPSERKIRSIFNFHSSDNKLSCNAIKMVGSLAELALTTSDLEGMSDTDIADCRVEFGAMELSEALQKQIWKRINNDLKMDGFHLLGRLLRVVSAPDLWDIKFQISEPWTLETIQTIIKNNNNTTVMKKLMDQVVRRNAEFSVDLLTVLGPAVCSLEADSLRALSVVGLDLGPSCPPCLSYLAERATEELGHINSWTFHFVYSLQTIVAGLHINMWKELARSDSKPLSGLQPSAAKCLNVSHLQVLSLDQIRMIPAVTLLSLSEHQLAGLNSTQREVVKNITHPTVDLTENMIPVKRANIGGFPTGISNQIVPPVLVIILLNLFVSLNIHM